MKRNLLLILAANESAAILAANSDGGSAVFEIAQPDSMFIPYGEYPHKEGLQVFDRAAADNIIAGNAGMLGRFRKWLKSENAMPVYIGHPDLPGSKDTDKKAYGWVSSMVAEAEGMRLGVKWSPAGNELISNAHYRYYSPAWWLKKSKGRMLPVGIQSIGLTNNPNIPVPALANEIDTEEIEEQQEQETNTEQQSESDTPIMNEILAALGLAEGATTEDCLAAIAAIKQTADDAAAEKLAADDAACAAKSDAETAKQETIAANDRLAAAANAAVQSAVVAGRIVPADAEAKVTEILAANDMAAAISALAALPPAMKVASATGDLGGAKAKLVLAANDASKARREERRQAVDSEFAAMPASVPEAMRRITAYQRAAAKNPALFSNTSPGSAA